MKLIPEQILYLHDEVRRIRKRLGEYGAYFDDLSAIDGDDTFRSQIGDYLTDITFLSECHDLNEYQKALDESELLRKRNFDYIDVGTKFRVSFDGDPDDTLEAFLVENRVGCKRDDNFISCESPLGRALWGAKEGEVVSYQMLHGIIQAKVEKIFKDEKDYACFIRDRSYSCRNCRPAKREIREAIGGSPEEYAKRLELSVSQRTMLLDELKRIGSVPPSKRNAVLDNRARVIRNYLNKCGCACPMEDGTIGIGSRFDLVLYTEDGKIERNVELINRAVGDELADEYVERISSLGLKLYGLREGDSFKFRHGNTYIVGCVHNIEQASLETYRKVAGHSFVKK